MYPQSALSNHANRFFVPKINDFNWKMGQIKDNGGSIHPNDYFQYYLIRMQLI